MLQIQEYHNISYHIFGLVNIITVHMDFKLLFMMLSIGISMLSHKRGIQNNRRLRQTVGSNLSLLTLNAATNVSVQAQAER